MDLHFASLHGTGNTEINYLIPTQMKIDKRQELYIQCIFLT